MEPLGKEPNQSISCLFLNPNHECINEEFYEDTSVSPF